MRVVFLTVISEPLSHLSIAAEDARVLPSGRSRFSMIYGRTEKITNNFNPQGQSESITQPYNLELGSQNLRRADERITQLVDYLNGPETFGLRYDVNQRSTSNKGIILSDNSSLPKLGDALSRGFLNVGAEAHREQYNLAYQYGISSRLTMGFTVPFIRGRVDVTKSINGPNTAQDIYQGFLARDPGRYQSLIDALGLIQSTSTETLQDVLTAKGYTRFENYKVEGFGDLVFGGRLKLVDTENSSGEWVDSVQMGATVPTGRLKSPSQITAMDLGDGAWDVGAAHILNYRPHWRVLFSNSVNYTYRFSSNRALRVRENADDFLPDSNSEELVKSRLGNKFWTVAGLKFLATQAISLDCSYEWYWKGLDRFQGSRPKDYSYLSENTDTYKETLQIGASISSIPSFLKSDFPVPGDLSLNYYRPFRGRNTPIAPYFTAELALYF